MEWSWPEEWYYWLPELLFAIITFLSIPFMLAFSLFKNVYVTFRNVTFRKLDMAVELRPARKCIEYFKGTNGGGHAELQSVPLPGR